MVSKHPAATFECSAEHCPQTDADGASHAMLKDTGKCSALLTREGFFDFGVFMINCGISYNVTLVCQHDQKANVILHDNMSDVKASIVGEFYSLQVFSSCDVGWF